MNQMKTSQHSMSNKGQFLTEVRDTIFSIDDISSAKAKKERETMHDIIIR